MHGKSIQSAVDDFDLFGECLPEYDSDEMETSDEVALIPSAETTRQPSNLLSSSGDNKPHHHRIITVLIFLMTLYYL